MMAWGAKVSQEFQDKALQIAAMLGTNVDNLMSAIAFESGETFRADIRNAAGSGAVGLIQFMPQTAAALGTSTDALAEMTPEDQLDYVSKYFQGYAGRVNSLSDLYMVILWPAAVGKPDDYVLFDQSDSLHPKRYIQNRGLDWNHDGKVTKAEAAQAVEGKLAKGRLPEYYG